MDLDFGGSINEDNLFSDANILMRSAKFGASEKREGANIIGKTAIPLNVALGMLRDKNDNITLEIPINGDVYDPSFGLKSIVGLVVKKVVMAKAKSYLINAFVPYAKVVKVALSAGSMALKVRFADLEYTPGQTQISETQSEFVEQIINLLTDKKNVIIRICPVATKADLVNYTEVITAEIPEIELIDAENIQESINSTDQNKIEITQLDEIVEFIIPQGPISDAQFEYLLSVAVLRAEAFKAKLVLEGKIESTRLLLCSPEYDEKGKDGPRLELGT